MIETIAQFQIAICGITSCYLTATNKAKYACIWGLLAEPAWVYSSLNNGQYGIFVLAIVYAVLWSYGIYNYWFKGRKI